MRLADHDLLTVICLVTCLSGSGCSSSTSHQQSKMEPSTASAPDSLQLKAILTDQPDFLAEEIFTEFEPRVHGGFSLRNKLAKKGDCYRSESDGSVFFFCMQKPTVYFNPRKKTIREVPSIDVKWYQHGSHVQMLVNEQSLTFEEIGTETIDSHDCRKIKVSRTTSNANDPTVFLYAAKDLRNLIIVVEVNLSDRTNRYVLRNVTFEVPVELFAPIERYNAPRS